MQIIRKHKKIVFSLFLLFFFLLLFPPACQFGRSLFVNRQFRACTKEIFQADVSGNPLNLHYTLAYPEASGIKDYTLSLGTIDSSMVSAQKIQLENRRSLIQSFPSDLLTKENQLTQKTLTLYYETELLPANQYLLDEYLSPSLGSQAQLPILLAEYSFRKEQDVQNYLKLLTSADTYLESILSFERLKAQNGTFMSDTTVDRIIQQCSSFIEQPEDHYLDVVFAEKLQELSNISDTKKNAYQKLHHQILSGQVLPAYQKLIDGLYLLKGSGKNPGGLCNFSGGTSYYEYLIKSTCGVYESVPEIQTRLITQFQSDLAAISSLINPSASPSTTITASPSEENTILEMLQKQMQDDFPSAPSVSYEIKYVPESLEEYLSPAFYLTPPIDTLSPNAIYINRHANLKGLELYTTLAHEGFPGHLYQTIFFASSNPDPIRHLLPMGGYVEGWATYTESFAYSYASSANGTLDGTLAWLNRSLNLCILSLLDTGIHYNGWSPQRCSLFLSQLGITDSETQQEIYQVILEDPANYLKYYLGYLHFLDLQTAAREIQGKEFQLRSFHRSILLAGPCQFPVLEEYLALN